MRGLRSEEETTGRGTAASASESCDLCACITSVDVASGARSEAGGGARSELEETDTCRGGLGPASESLNELRRLKPQSGPGDWVSYP